MCSYDSVKDAGGTEGQSTSVTLTTVVVVLSS